MPRHEQARRNEARPMNFPNDTPGKKRTFPMFPRRKIIRSIAVAALFTLAGTNVYAETFPTRPVRSR
jgi:hypothetical protein